MWTVVMYHRLHLYALLKFLLLEQGLTPQSGLEHIIYLPLPPTCWDYRCVPPFPALMYILLLANFCLNKTTLKDNIHEMTGQFKGILKWKKDFNVTICLLKIFLKNKDCHWCEPVGFPQPQNDCSKIKTNIVPVLSTQSLICVLQMLGTPSISMSPSHTFDTLFSLSPSDCVAL